MIDKVKLVLYKTIMKITDKNFLYSLSVIRKQAFNFLEKGLAKEGIENIPASHGDIINIISELGESCVKDITKRSYKDKSTISFIIKNLVKLGYAEKITDKLDGRMVRVRLTEKGKNENAKASYLSDSLVKKLFSDMSVEERNILFMLLAKVEKNLKSV